MDIVLIPEVPFELDQLLDHVSRILEKRGHVVICTAEGAGQARGLSMRTDRMCCCSGAILRKRPYDGIANCRLRFIASSS